MFFFRSGNSTIYCWSPYQRHQTRPRLLEVEATSSLPRWWESHCVTTCRDAWCSASLNYLSPSASGPPSGRLNSPTKSLNQSRRNVYNLTAGLTKVWWNEPDVFSVISGTEDGTKSRSLVCRWRSVQIVLRINLSWAECLIWKWAVLISAVITYVWCLYNPVCRLQYNSSEGVYSVIVSENSCKF